MIDLKDLLDERSAAPTELMQHLRLSQVERRIKVRNQRRVAVGAVCSLVILAILGYAVMPKLNSAPTPPAATPSATATAVTTKPYGFAEFSSGRRVVAGAQGAVGQGSVSVTWTPTTLEFAIRDRCEVEDQDLDLDTSVLINGRKMFGSKGGCGESSVWFEAEGLAEAGVKIGEPSTFTLRINGASTSWMSPSPRPVPLPQGTMSIAIATKVPFAEYPFPARPAELKALKNTVTCEESDLAWKNRTPAPMNNLLRSDPANPNQPLSMKLVWKGNFILLARAQTPGIMRIAVNGMVVDTASWWNYEASLEGPRWNTTDKDDRLYKIEGWQPPRQGELVTVTVTPEHFTGAWQLRAAQTRDPVGHCFEG